MRELGVPYSPFTGKPITSQTITQIVDLIKNFPKNLQFIYMRQLFVAVKVNIEKIF